MAEEARGLEVFCHTMWHKENQRENTRFARYLTAFGQRTVCRSMPSNKKGPANCRAFWPERECCAIRYAHQRTQPREIPRFDSFAGTNRNHREFDSLQSGQKKSDPSGSLFFGQRENRTPDTGIFSPLLYRLSYLAWSLFFAA